MLASEKLSNSTFWSNLFKLPAERTDLEDVLHSMPPFRNFSTSHLQHLIKIIHNRLYSPGEYIFYQNDPGIALYMIREGEVKIVKQNDGKDDFELARFFRGDFFGELALLDNDVRSASAVSVKESNLAVIFKPDLDRFMEKFPKKGLEILQGLAQIIATRLRLLDDEYLNLYNKSEVKNEEVNHE